MGWYQGLGGRLVWQSPEIPGIPQESPVDDPVTNMVEAQWTPSLTLPTDASWPQGDYLLKLVGSSGNQQLIPITLRDDNVPECVPRRERGHDVAGVQRLGRLLAVPLPGPGVPGRGRVVRPTVRLDRRCGRLPRQRVPAAAAARASGATTSPTRPTSTCSRHPELLLHHKAVLSMGHDEYWSKSMRDGMEAARDHGVNLAFFGANAAYRQIRFERVGQRSRPPRDQLPLRPRSDLVDRSAPRRRSAFVKRRSTDPRTRSSVSSTSATRCAPTWWCRRPVRGSSRTRA